MVISLPTEIIPGAFIDKFYGGNPRINVIGRQRGLIKPSFLPFKSAINIIGNLANGKDLYHPSFS
jgi:hypothetical protein